ncbi:phage holin family protein [Bacillus sp. 3255]|uniref:phage holin family protein n=1 Tax=Bacillus sp. 3255 TaxID=2817904 RepID=UPI00286AC2AF|nr:phage holin family protein [Bacillus sp. 3255]
MTAAGITGAAVSYAFGGWSELLSFFLLAIGVDYVTGLVASLKEGKGLNSSVGFWGLAKKAFMLVVVMLAHRMDILLGTDVLMTGAIYFYLANELISITENYGRMGYPMPPKLKEIIQVLKAKGDGTSQDKDVQQ